jgi:hypothetical protein
MGWRRRHVLKAPQSRSITLSMVVGKLASLGGVVAAALLGAASAPAAAAPMLRNLPFGDNRGAPMPLVARYVAADGQSFVLDRASSGQPLLKFDDNPEVWVLEPFPATRGDTIYRNDLGAPVLRATHLGGLTLYSSSEPEGSPVAMEGEAEDLQPPPVIAPSVLLQRFALASIRATRAAQHLIAFSLGLHPSQADPQFADAATVVAEALTRLSRRPEGHAFLMKLDRVIFQQGAKPDVSVKGPVMQITVAPNKGYSGRPSSDRVVRAALGR